MSTFYKYRIFCETENKYVFVILDKDDPPPTKCPNNTSDKININTVAIVDTIEEREVIIKEENGKTGGSFGTVSCTINATANTTTSITMTWPYPISALCQYFVSTEENKKDLLTLSINENRKIGVITDNISPATAWTTQNYNAGQIVTYTHPIFGSRVYTCIANTNNNQEPTNNNYWKHGFELKVSSTVLLYTSTGYSISISGNGNTNDVGRVISVDKDNQKIYVEKNISNSFVSTADILQTVYLLKDFEIGNPSDYSVGLSKIGGSYIIADSLVKISYKNLTNNDKYFNGRMEYLY